MSIIPSAYQIALQNARKAMTDQLKREVRQLRRVRIKAVGRPVAALRSNMRGMA